MLFPQKLLLNVVLILLPVFVWSQSQLHTQTGPFGQQLLIEQHPQTQAPQHIWNVNAPLVTIGHTMSNITQRNASNVGRQFLSHFAPILGVSQAELDALLVRQSSRNQWHLKYRQRYQDIPVWRSYVAITIEPSGHIRNIHSRIFPDITVNTTPTISSTDAEGIVQSDTSIIIGDSSWVAEVPRLLIYPDMTDTVAYHLVWKVRGLSSGPRTDISVFVDAHSGGIVEVFNNLRQAEIYGTVRKRYFPEHYNDTPEDGEGIQNVHVELHASHIQSHEHATLGTDNTDVQGEYSIPFPYPAPYAFYHLHGDAITLDFSNTYIAIQNANNSNNHRYHFIPTESNEHNWGPATDETNVYHHMNEIHDYYLNTHNYNGMNYQMKGYVHQGPIYNGAANGTDIYFGSMDINGDGESEQWAKSSDVIYHEYTHNTIYHLYGSWIGYSGQAAAMDEGLSDYFASTLNNDNVQGESVLISRDLSNNREFDEAEDEYFNGTVIGGAIWNMRETGSIGPTLADALLFGALEYADAHSFGHLLTDVVYTDDAMNGDGNPNNGTPHLDAILQAFYNHVIYPSDPAIPPRRPQNVSLAEQNNQALASWDANPEPDIAEYKVYRKLDPDPFHPNDRYPKFYHIITTTNTSYLDPDFSPGFGSSTAWYKVKAVDQYGSQSTYSATVSSDGLIRLEKPTVPPITADIPEHYGLAGNFPNPFNPSTTIRYQLPEPSSVRITVYNIMGQRVRTLVNSSVPAGYQSVIWDGTTVQRDRVASGTYLLRAEFHSLESEASFTKTTKMLILQ